MAGETPQPGAHRQATPPASRTLWLAEQAQTGDLSALAELVERVRPRVERWTALRLGSTLRGHLDCEDLVQDTLVGAWRSVGAFQGSSAKDVERWLREILENRIRDGRDRVLAQKRDARREERLSAEPAGRAATASQFAIRGEEQRRVLDAMLTLSDPEREVLRLIRFEGRSYEEAGELMGITAKNAGVRLVRAMQALRSRLEPGQSGT